MSYLGRSAKLSLKAQEKVSFLATAGQTSKTGLSYTPSFVEVYVNGVLLTDTTDYTATNGNSITFTVALLVNDEVTVVSLKTFASADHYTKSAADTLLAAKSPLASPSFTGTVSADQITSDTIEFKTGVNGSGLRGGTNIVVPYKNGADSDGSLDIGRAANRFKDLYLSGGVYLGGTGAANLISDYEEGTFTVAITMATGTAAVHGSYNTLSYTKVGRLVTVNGQFRVGTVSSPDGELKINLPFTCANQSQGEGFSTGSYRTYQVDTPNDGTSSIIRTDPNSAYAVLEWSRDSAASTYERATANG